MQGKPFERILVPLDLSPASDIQVVIAGELARRYNSEIILFHVIDSMIIEHAAAGFDPEKIIMTLEQHARNKLKQYKEILENKEVLIDIYDEIPVEDPASAIINASVRAGATEILLLNKGWRVKRSILLGGTVKEVVKKTVKPLILFHVTYDKQNRVIRVTSDTEIAKRIVLAIDKHVKEDMIQYVKQIAQNYGTEELYILHVLEEGESKEIIDSKLLNLQKEFAEYVETVHRILLTSHKIAKVIINFAENVDATIVVGRTVKKGLLEWFLGSTLDHILSRATRPVIIYPLEKIE